MALFKRTTKDSVLPEVDQYYQAERRDRGALAWLLALASIAAVALVIVLLFLGGRWIYRELTDDNPEVVTTGDNSDETPSFDGTPPAEETPSEDGTGTNGGETTPPADENEDENDSENQGDTEAPAPTDTPSNTTPRTGDDSSDLPSTGPADTLAIFAVTTAAGTVAHYAISRKRSDKESRN